MNESCPYLYGKLPIKKMQWYAMQSYLDYIYKKQFVIRYKTNIRCYCASSCVGCLGGAPFMVVVSLVHAIHNLSNVNHDTLGNVVHTHIE